MSEHLFTSESVSEGHPDKIADQISDAVLDETIRQISSELSGEPLRRALWGTRVACETLVKTGMVIVAGEMRTGVHVDIEDIARRVVREIGYSSGMGFDGDDCAVMVAIGKQSGDIAHGVDLGEERIGAGDQGMMFGYACSETPEKMPAPIVYAHRLTARQSKVRRLGRRPGGLPWLRPDAKAQVTFRYRDSQPVAVEGIVLSTQHDPEIDGKRVANNDRRLREAVIEHIIRPVVEPRYRLPHAKAIHVNPTGRFVEGGPKADCGLTGRKIIVDTYGGMAPHGGGAFSGKDPTKVDRSGAYAARHIAKNIVHAGIAKRCLVQVAYAIGVPDPVSLAVETFGTAHPKWDDARILRAVRALDCLSPGKIIRGLDLWRPTYRKVAVHGHFGRKDPDITWERTDLADRLR